MSGPTVQFTLGENNPARLTSWAKEPSVSDLKCDFDAAKPTSDRQAQKITHWNNLRDVKGEARPPQIKGRSKVQPKLIRRQAEWRYSALTEPFHSSADIYDVKPTTWEDAAAARQNGLVLNWQWRTKLNRVKFIDDYVRSTVDDGTAIVRIGWKRATVKVKQPTPVWSYYQIQDPQDAQALQQAIAAKQADPHDFTDNAPPALQKAVEYYEQNQVPVIAQQTGTQLVEVETVLENRPTVEVVNPANVTIDPSCQGDLDKALFIVYSFETNQAELKKDGRYKNLDRINWDAATILNQPDHETTTPNDFNLRDSARKKLVAYEYWGFYDVKGDGVLVGIVGTWIGDVMIRMEENPFPDGKLPFVLVPYLPKKREMYGEPDAELLEENQQILGAVTRGVIDLLGKSANGQQGMAKGMLDPLNKRRFEAGQDYEFNPNMSPATGLIEHKYPELPQSAIMVQQMMNADAESLTGVKSFSGGVSGEAYGSVATGIKGVLDAAGKRETAILRRLAEGMIAIGIKICAMNAVFLSEEETVRVTNDTFVQVKREDLKGNFDLEVDIDTAEGDNAKAQDLGFMLQTIGPNMDPDITREIMAEIADLKRMPELAHTLRTFKPQPDPMQQQKAQLEIMLLQAQIGEAQGQALLYQAQAKLAGSTADLKNLDFVETETGTKHARTMAEQQAQSQGNQNLEVTRALTQPVKEGEKKPDISAAVGFNLASGKLSGLGSPPTAVQ